MPFQVTCIRGLVTGFHGILCRLSLLSVCLLATLTAAAAEIEQQRNQFQQARKAIESGHTEKFRHLAAGLEDYPLYPYLRYEYIRRHLRSMPEAEIAAFLEQHPDFPLTAKLRNKWLDLLASRGRWQDYIDYYVQPNDNRLRCLYLIARMNTGHDEHLLEDIRTMWLVGYSQHDSCDPAFAKLEASPLMTADLVWDRIRLALESNETGLANYLIGKLRGAAHTLALRWIEMHRHPESGTRNPQVGNTPQGREIVLHGIRRLARTHLERALDRWVKLKTDYSFMPAERNRIERHLAIRAADEKHPLARQLLDRVARSEVDATVFLYRLRHALNTDDWQKLREWTTGQPSGDIEPAQWRYWHARALEHTGDQEAARDIYRQLAAERDFYGFLAADRLNIGYQMNHFPLPISMQQRQKVANMPGIRRAFEFLALGEEYSARREWHHALEHMTSYQMQIAASLAAKHNWHDRAILALGKAKAYDDLEMRFPIMHHATVANYAAQHGLDVAWIYGIIRTESAFWEDARSPAGALGLMQVMPRTGRETARRLGMKNFSNNQLLQAKYNIPIGSQYLKMMYDDFNNNLILATAAYNAGPHRVRAWLPDTGCMQPDVWIENIPFRETRNYVKRVLSYASIYDWRLRGESKPLSTRMALIKPLRKTDTMLAALNCSATAITMNK